MGSGEECKGAACERVVTGDRKEGGGGGERKERRGASQRRDEQTAAPRRSQVCFAMLTWAVRSSGSVAIRSPVRCCGG